MKAIKLITTLFSLLFLLLLSGCMPDSITKWEETPPIKDDAPLVTVPAPKNYSYSSDLGGAVLVSVDLNAAFPTLTPDDTFEGSNVTFSVSPSLPNTITLNPTTGVISGTATSLTPETEYTFTATNTGGSVETTFSIQIKQPEVLSTLTYTNQATGDNVSIDDQGAQITQYLQVDKWFRFNATVGTTSVTWDIDVKVDPADPYVDSADPIEAADYPIDCVGKIKVVRGVCFDQLNGSIMGAPRDVITVPFEVKVTVSKASPASSATQTVRMSFLNKPSGLTYSQSSLMELSISTNPGIIAGQYIKLTDNKGTSSTADDTCTFAQVDSVIGTSALLVKKHNSSDRITNSFSIKAYSNALTTPSSLACNATSNADMLVPTTSNVTIYQVSNVFEAEKEFTLNPILTSGEEVTYSINPVLPPDVMTNPTFNGETGELKGALKDNYTAKAFTIKAANKVGETSVTVNIYPVQLPPQDLNYSSQVLLMVRDASSFNVGDWISTPINNTISPPNPDGGYGKVIGKFYEPSTLTSAIIVNIERGQFTGDSSLDNHEPFFAEETSSSGYVILEVASTTNFAVGDFVSNENIGFGKIRAIKGPNLYVSVLGGVFSTDDAIQNIYPYDDPHTADTTILDVKSDNLIQGHTATLTVLTGNTTSAAVTPAADGDVVSTGANRGIVTLAEINPVVALTIADISNYYVGSTITQGGVTGTVYAKVEGAAPSGTVFVNQITGGDFSLGAIAATSITTVNYGHRFFYRGIAGKFSQGDTIATQSGTIGTLGIIEARNYQAKVTEVGGSNVKVRAGATLATLNSSNLTGDSVGRVIYKDTVLSLIHLELDNGILAPTMKFDTKNPIDQIRVGTHPTLSSVSTTQNIILRRGVKTKLFRSLARQVKATYSIYPPLPVGLDLSTETGEISGTPKEASLFKVYTVTATTKKGNAKFSFNMKVEEYFEVKINNPEASYILHRIGKNAGPRSCRVYKDQLAAGEGEEIDVTCYLEAGELDLYLLGLDFEAVSGPGMCNHVAITPSSYYNKPYYGDSTYEENKYYYIEMQGGCTMFMRDRDNDGYIDYLVKKPKADGDCLVYGGLYNDGDGDGDCKDETKDIMSDGDNTVDFLVMPPAIPGTPDCPAGVGDAVVDSDDGDGDGDCIDEAKATNLGGPNIDTLVAPANPLAPGCPAGTGDAVVDSDDGDGDADCIDDRPYATESHYGINIDEEFAITDDIADDTMLCNSNFSKDIKCDAGRVAKKVLTSAPIYDNSIFCQVPATTYTSVDCGGQRSSCISGAVTDFLSAEELNEGKETRILKGNINEEIKFPFKTIIPINKSLYSNRFLANFSVNHDFFRITNRESDYSFNITGFNNFFNSSYLGYGDPQGGMHPSNTFECLDQSNNPKARIHVLVREWDTKFDILSAIDMNNSRMALSETVASQLGKTITLSGAVDTTQILPGSIISMSAGAAHGTQYYRVSSVSGDDIILNSTPTRTYPAGTTVYHTPIYNFDELWRITDTMDTGWTNDPVFGDSFNKQDDFDNTVQPEVTSPPTSEYLMKQEFINSTLVADQLPIGTTVTFVYFSKGVLQTEVLGLLTVLSSSSNKITLSSPIRKKLFKQKHYLRKSDGLNDDKFYAIETVEKGEDEVTVYPLTRPFTQDFKEEGIKIP